MVKGKLFEIARQNSKYKICDGCGEKKSINDFKKGNKWCNKCPKLNEIKDRYKTNISPIQEIEDINLDDFFKNL